MTCCLVWWASRACLGRGRLGSRGCQPSCRWSEWSVILSSRKCALNHHVHEHITRVDDACMLTRVGSVHTMADMSPRSATSHIKYCALNHIH